MSFQYKVAIIGPIPKDHITTYRGEVIEKYGGINNPTVALARLLGEKSTIVPVTHIREKDLEAVKEILRPFPNIDMHSISVDSDQGNVIRLRFIDQNKRQEKQSGFMNPITTEDVKNLLDCDIFTMVPVTDFEVSLEALKFVKSYSDATVIFDAHGLTNTMTVLGDRLFKFWIDRDIWLPYIDILKMNMEEAKCCWFRKSYKLMELENEYEFGLNDLPAFARYCLSKGVKAIYVTLDEKGCVVYFQENGKLQEKFVKGVQVENVVDTTGCGDSFAAGLTFGILTTGDYVKAAQYANVVGAQRTQGKTFDVFKSYEETKKMVLDTYEKD